MDVIGIEARVEQLTATTGGTWDARALCELAEAVPGVFSLDLLARHDQGTRTYRQLFSTDEVEAWMICWLDDADTGYHDHDGSSGAVHIARGALAEDRIAIGVPSGSLTRTFAEGSSFSFDDRHIHRLRHAGGGPAVSVHVYSPPLQGMGTYEVGEGGALRRGTVPASVELTATEPHALEALAS